MDKLVHRKEEVLVALQWEEGRIEEDIHHQVQEVVDKHLDRQMVAGQDRQLVAELHKLEEEAEQDTT